MIIEQTLEEMKGDYDWKEAFAYASDGPLSEDDFVNGAGSPTPIPGESCHTTPFSMEDIAVLFGAVVGEHDAADWLAVGRLKDGRFFSLHAGCDYTGWD
jgi:hypothetical protein